MKQGELVLLDFPYADGTGSKWRPAVVLSNQGYNRHANVLLAGLYGKRQPFSVRITNDDMQHGRLRKLSHISLQNIFSADKSFVQHVVAAISRRKLQQVLAEVRKCF